MNNTYEHLIPCIFKTIFSNVVRFSTEEMAAKRFKCSGTFEMTISPEDLLESTEESITEEELAQIARNFSSEEIINIAEDYLQISVKKAGKENQWNYIFNLLKTWMLNKCSGKDARQVRLYFLSSYTFWHTVQ